MADAVAGQMERYYSPGRTWEATARGLLGLVQLGDVLDAGSGDGAMARCWRRAREHHLPGPQREGGGGGPQRLGHLTNVAFVPGDLHELPFPDEPLRPGAAVQRAGLRRRPRAGIAEAARVLRPGAQLVVPPWPPHDHREATAATATCTRGFSARKLEAGSRPRLMSTRCEITSREKRPPNFEVVSAFARKPQETDP